MAALVGSALAGCKTEPEPCAYGKSYIGCSKADVMTNWSKCWRATKAYDFLPWPDFCLYTKADRIEADNVKHCDYFHLELPDADVSDETIRGHVQEAMKDRRIQESVRWDCFETRLPDRNPFDFKEPRKRLSVWFDDNGVVTGQCANVYTHRDG